MTRIPAPMLSSRQIAVCAVWGAILWALAAVLLRAMAAAGLTEGAWLALIYGVTIPVTAVFLGIVQVTAKARGQMLQAMGVATAVAALIDGIVIGWLPWVYAPEPAQVARVAATILWGVGLGLVGALWMDRRTARG